MRHLLCSIVVMLWPAVGLAQQVLELSVAAGDFDRVNEPVVVPIHVAEQFAGKPCRLVDGAGKAVPCQLTENGILTEGRGRAAKTRDLHFILPGLKAGETASFKLTLGAELTPEAGFNVSEKANEYSEIRWKDRPILRYVHPPLDETSKETREQTYKVFHHLYDPSGKRLITKGPGGLYTHHRGLFYGFNKVTYGGGKKVDIWHCPVAYQSHEKFVENAMGPVLARQRLKLAWHGIDKEVFAIEDREVDVYNVPGGTLLDFSSKLVTTNGAIQLDGDPQHAGFHFRADDEVAGPAKEKPAKVNEKTVFIRPDGVGQPGKTRNWPDLKTHVNLPWNAMSFVLGEDRFTVAYLDRPANPKEARFSERDYGRLGSYFVFEVTKEKPLVVGYRIWLQKGQMAKDEVDALSRAFVKPVKVTVK